MKVAALIVEVLAFTSRKNYLFAGSHDAASRAGMIYSFFAICKKHDVNPFEWLKYALQHIMIINHKEIRNLYAQKSRN
jgi:hypothetical protein